VLTRSVALAPTLLVALLAGSPNKLDVLNQWLNVLQSIQLPFAIVPVRARACEQLQACGCSDLSVSVLAAIAAVGWVHSAALAACC
jgi:hypothetical protein